ncbi:glucose 1-dehydrogenase [Litorimonas sp. RW-G-Af-16]|uniref:glucose 1-dehydrogenase n=1 Tax=Litorimonas sp. RW-G-Af-16 TaxID=3241168 RepID=UPI00390CB793
MARFDLTGKVALIAGASRGIGEAIAHGLAEHGATVICSSRKQADCEKVAEAIRANGGKAVSAELHLGELSHHDTVLKMIEKEFGRLDILINNGATNPYFGPAHETPETAYDKTMDVNVKGPFFLSAKSMPMLMKDGGGSIVNVASIDGIQPGQMRVVYGMTKAALINMTKGLAKEYGNQGVRVNALLPGFTDTKLAAGLKDMPGMDKYMQQNLAISRMAQPEEMVGAVLYMVSDEASYFTGQGMVVDAGAII